MDAFMEAGDRLLMRDKHNVNKNTLMFFWDLFIFAFTKGFYTSQ